MKSFPYPALLSLVIYACSGEQTPVSTSETQLTNTPASADTVLFYQGTLDEMDGTFYVSSQNDDSLADDIKEIHIVPEVSDFGVSDSGETAPFMFGIVSTDFEPYPLSSESFSGKVKVFYDAMRTLPVTEFTMAKGKVNGPVKVYAENGDLIISRIYENGVCISSVRDIYAIDWKFNPSTSELEIEKFAAYKSTDEDGNQLINLGQSMYPATDDYKNDLYELIQKPVFDTLFLVNGQPYTGTLMGYQPYRIIQPALSDAYFELVFLQGKLNDTIRLYGDWGELVLEEKFENGVLTETIYELDYSEMDGMAKPVIYLYPEKDMTVNVQLDLKGKMTHSYPAYPQGGWDVWAKQNGTLYDHTGKEFYALFWEGASSRDYTYAEGFVIKGSETATFLENSLEILGLTRREANEFIMYWLPQMENNAYNLIHFSTDEYADIAALKVTPKPESLIRIMMVWSPLENPVDLPQQNLYDLQVERNGFTVVEWGGKKQEYQPNL